MGVLIAFRDGRALGLIARTGAGFETIEAGNHRHIGTYADFVEAEGKLARLTADSGSDKSEPTLRAPLLEFVAAAALASAAAIATIAVMTYQ